MCNAGAAMLADQPHATAGDAAMLLHDTPRRPAPSAREHRTRITYFDVDANANREIILEDLLNEQIDNLIEWDFDAVRSNRIISAHIPEGEGVCVTVTLPEGAILPLDCLQPLGGSITIERRNALTRAIGWYGPIKWYATAVQCRCINGELQASFHISPRD